MRVEWPRIEWYNVYMTVILMVTLLAVIFGISHDYNSRKQAKLECDKVGGVVIYTLEGNHCVKYLIPEKE